MDLELMYSQKYEMLHGDMWDISEVACIKSTPPLFFLDLGLGPRIWKEKGFLGFIALKPIQKLSKMIFDPKKI